MLDEKYDSQRTRALRRFTDYKKALRKKKISDSYGCFSRDGDGWYKYFHQYSKGKIHCSCPMCRAKTKNKGKRRKGSWAPAYNPTICEMKSNDRMDCQMKEMEER